VSRATVYRVLSRVSVVTLREDTRPARSVDAYDALLTRGAAG
jgi:hypothetical protein